MGAEYVLSVCHSPDSVYIGNILIDFHLKCVISIMRRHSVLCGSRAFARKTYSQIWAIHECLMYLSMFKQKCVFVSETSPATIRQRKKRTTQHMTAILQKSNNADFGISAGKSINNVWRLHTDTRHLSTRKLSGDFRFSNVANLSLAW